VVVLWFFFNVHLCGQDVAKNENKEDFTGDWNGVRSRIADNGIDLTFLYFGAPPKLTEIRFDLAVYY
jgi:hypothetical protein